MRSLPTSALIGAIVMSAGAASAQFDLFPETLVDNTATFPGTTRTYNILSTPAADGVDAVFFGQSTPVPSLQRGIYRAVSGGTITTIAERNSPAPDGLTFTDVFSGAQADTGYVVFNARRSDGTLGLYASDGSTTSVVTDTGVTSPEAAGSFTSFGRFQLDGQTVAFQANTRPFGTFLSGIYVATSPGDLTKVAKQTDTFPVIGTLSDADSPSIAGGTVAFWASASTTGAGVYASTIDVNLTPTDPRAVATVSTDAPGYAPGTTFDSFGEVDVGSPTQIYFGASVGANDGIYVEDDGALALVVDSGSTLPGLSTGDTFAVNLDSFSAGEDTLVFEATGSFGDGVWGWFDGDFVQLLATGDMVGSRVVSTIGFASFFDAVDGLNVTVDAAFTDGSRGIVSIILVPFVTDTDGDGLLDTDETDVYGTDPNNPDTDGDTLSDGDEVLLYSTDPLNADSDSDALSDADELLAFGTDPNDPDTDADGVDDGSEISLGSTTHPCLDPLNPDSDLDGLADGAEINEYFTDPCEIDTDADGLEDGAEVELVLNGDFPCLNPLDPDSDIDGLTDGEEISVLSTSPCNTDTDEDGVPDGLDPYPTDPNGTEDALEMMIRDLACDVHNLALDEFVGPVWNPYMRRGNLVRRIQRAALVTKLQIAAGKVRRDRFSAANHVVECVYARVDSEPCPEDWLVEDEAGETTKADIAAQVELILDILSYLD